MANQAYLNGAQKMGSSVRPLQNMKSGSLPPADSSFRYIAIAYPPSPKNTPCPRLSIPA